MKIDATMGVCGECDTEVRDNGTKSRNLYVKPKRGLIVLCPSCACDMYETLGLHVAFYRKELLATK